MVPFLQIIRKHACAGVLVVHASVCVFNVLRGFSSPSPAGLLLMAALEIIVHVHTRNLVRAHPGNHCMRGLTTGDSVSVLIYVLCAFSMPQVAIASQAPGIQARKY